MKNSIRLLRPGAGTVALALALLLVPGRAIAAYEFFLEELNLVSGPAGTVPQLVFQDTFFDGNPPPSAPPFLSGVAASYGNFLGSFPMGSEAGGRLSFNSANAQSITNAFGTFDAALRMTLLTGVTTVGLSRNNVFGGSGLFVLPAAAPEAGTWFGTRFEDLSFSNGNDVVTVRVFGTGGGNAAIQMTHADFGFAGTPASSRLVASVAYAPPVGAAFIELALVHAVSGSATVTGGFTFYDLFHNPLGALTTLGSTEIFHGENFTRLSVLAVAVPEANTYAMMLAGLAVLGCVAYRRGRRLA